MKLVGGRFRTLRELDEPRVRGWDPDTLRKPQSCHVLHPDDKVLGGRLTKVFPETFRDTDWVKGVIEKKVEVEPVPRPKLPFGIDCPIVRPSQAVIDRIRTVGHGDFEEKVRLLGMSGKWDPVKLLSSPESGGDCKVDGEMVDRELGDSMERTNRLPVENPPVPWQTDYMQNFSGDVIGCGAETITKLRSMGDLGTDGDQGSLRLFGEDDKSQWGLGQCGTTVEVGKLGESVGRIGESDRKDVLVAKSTRLPVPTFHSTMYNAVTTSLEATSG